MSSVDRKGGRDLQGRPSRSKSRKGVGGRPTKSSESTERAQQSQPNLGASSASKRKLSDTASESGPEANSTFGYELIEFESVFGVLSIKLACSVCYGKITFAAVDRRGLGFKISIKCENCEEQKVNSCPLIGRMGNAYEVNRRSVLASRMVGLGCAGLRTFCGYMDLPAPISHSAHADTVRFLRVAAESVGNASMSKAALEEKELTPDGKIVVSGDGSWHTPGFKSLHGVAAVLGYKTGKVLDLDVLSAHCQACTVWEPKAGTTEYEEWLEQHEPHCLLNFEGSAGNMEVQGITRIFKRSEEKHGMKYHYYVGDGDTKTFQHLLQESPYEDVVVEKKECVGHVQKRMGTRLRGLKKEWGREKLSDGKTIGGEGRLSASTIDQLTVYYGMAIRDNCLAVSYTHLTLPTKRIV